jgi:hypothetical protein
VTDLLYILGADEPSGITYCRHLAAAGKPFVPVVQDVAAWRASGLPGEHLGIDFANLLSMATVLADARRILCCAHPRHVPSLLAVLHHDIRLILLGGAIRYGRNPDGEGIGVRAGEAAFKSSSRSGVMLHPTYLYGHVSIAAQIAQLRRTRTLLLPEGARRRVQPLHEDDLVAAIEAALEVDWPGPRNLVLAGPETMPMLAYLEAVARGGRIPLPRLVRLPALAGSFGSAAAARLGWPPEDQSFPVAPFEMLVGRPPLGFAAGLARALKPDERR